MNETKRCPACNQQVPVLAVRCKFCGVRLDATASTAVDAFAPTAAPPPSDFDEDLDLDTDLEEEELPDAPMPDAPRISAPPPVRASTPHVGAPAAPIPPAASVPPATPIPPAVAPQAPSMPPVAPRISAPPVSAPAMPSAPPVVAPPVVAPPSSASAPPRPVDDSAPETPPAAASPLSTKRTLLGMAPVVLPPKAEASLPRPSSAPADEPLPTSDTALDNSDDTPLPGDLEVSGDSLLSDDDFDSLNLDGDILDDDIDEISKFTEQTAITDVSTLARGMSDGAPDDLDADVSPDFLNEIMDSGSPAASSEQAAPSTSVDTSSSFELAATSFATAAPKVEPIGPILDSELDADLPPAAAPKKRSTAIFLTVLGVIMFAAGGFIAYKFLMAEEDGGLDTSVAATEKKPPAAAPVVVAEKAPPSPAPSEEKAQEPAPPEPAAAPKFPEHKCTPLSEYSSFAWRDKLDELAKSSDKTGICGLFGLSKETVVSAFRETPNFGPTGYDLLPKSTIFEVFPMGKADRRAPTMEFLFMDDLLYEIRLKFGMSNADSLDSSIFKKTLGKADMVPGDPLSREIKIYTDEDLLILWYKKTDAFKRVFNEVVFSSRTVRADFEKEFKARSDAQVAFEQGTALYNQKKIEQAVEKFKKARQIVPAMGKAYIFEGIALLQNEQFDKIESIAAEAFKNSSDDRARAGAKGLQAVAALYNGDKESALMLFNNAVGLDPTDSEYSFSAEELKTGQYKPARTAKTAARMACRRDHPEWSVKGLLARGNFPDNETFQKAKKQFRKKAAYKNAFKMWNAWECR